MKFLTLATLWIGIVMIHPGVAHSLDDARALSGLTSVRAIFDVRTSEEKTLQFMFTTIRDTLDATVSQNVKPHYVISIRGPAVKLLIRSRHGDPEVQERTNQLIGELNQRGVRLEACSYALDLFGLEAEDLVDGVHAVGNSLNSLIAYQTKGYALVPMN
jgi:intracellular sulfur oxidation DsrE/DsrF family protein